MAKKKKQPLSQYWKGYPREKCHAGNLHVFNIGKVKIYAGGESRGVDISKADILIPGVPHKELTLSGLTAKIFPNLAKCLVTRPVLPTACADGSAPRLFVFEWEAIIKDLLAIKEEKIALVWCVGGHGRTGTILAVLYGLTHPNGGDPVVAIRKLYCKNVVETQIQIDYIQKMTGIKVAAKNSYATKVYTQTTSSYRLPPPTKIIGENDSANNRTDWKESQYYTGWEYVHTKKKYFYRRQKSGRPPNILTIDETNPQFYLANDWVPSEKFTAYEYSPESNLYRSKI